MDLGASSAVISTCQLARKQDSDDIWKKTMETLMSLTGNIPLGTYECPVPYKRVLSTDLFRWIAQSGQVNFHKDTCCNLKQIREKLLVSINTPLHFFNAHLRVEKFPVDDVIFTGRLSEAELAHERPAEYERLVATGEIEELRVAPAPAWQRPVAIAIGVIAMLIGFTTVIFIILAGIHVFSGHLV